MRYSLLLLFLIYHSSITLFTHSHAVDSKTIVHSHLYNPFAKKNPTNHQHSKSELLLIQVLTHFLTTAALLTLFPAAPSAAPCNAVVPGRIRLFFGSFLLCSNGLRAPPIAIHG